MVDNLTGQYATGGHDPASSIFKHATKLFSQNFTTKRPPELRRSISWGESIQKDKFEDIDLLESGFAREYLAEECLSPTDNDKRWTNCYVERVDKFQFKLFEDETNRFLLSAKQVDSTFYISQYEDFPELEGTPSNYYCAVLQKHPTLPNFKLYNCGCEGCDKGYMTYSCTPRGGNPSSSHSQSDSDPDSRNQQPSSPQSSSDVQTHPATFDSATEIFDCQQEPVDRQLLADIRHSIQRIKYVDADMRNLNVVLPGILPDRRSRVVWCPRQNGSTTRVNATPSREDSTRFVVTSPRSNNNLQTFVDDGTYDDRIELQSKLPEWNHDLESLVLKFHGGRVLAASSKNLLLGTKDDPTRGILQFGKSRKGKFVLDFRYPMAPVQAFGICLSMCAWSAE